LLIGINPTESTDNEEEPVRPVNRVSQLNISSFANPKSGQNQCDNKENAVYVVSYGGKPELQTFPNDVQDTYSPIKKPKKHKRSEKKRKHSKHSHNKSGDQSNKCKRKINCSLMDTYKRSVPAESRKETYITLRRPSHERSKSKKKQAKSTPAIKRNQALDGYTNLRFPSLNCSVSPHG
jgi:hypothetical protein